MERTNTLVASAWLVAILSSFALGIEAGLACTLGYLGQWLKGVKAVPTVLAQLATGVLCIGAYAAMHWPGGVPSEDWIKQAALWALSALGVGSLAAGTRGAPKTDSL